MLVRYGWHPAKNASNFAKHGVSFATMDGFGWETAYVRGDVRNSQVEVRLNAIGPINDRLFHVTFTLRRPYVLGHQPAAGQQQGDRPV